MTLPPEIAHLLTALVLFQLKHFICDGPLQTKAMVDAKSIYGATLGLTHAGIHGLGTFVVFVISGFDVRLAAALALADFVLHYHIDFSKENIVKWQGWTVKDAPFWWALSADQMLHHLTYLALAAIAFKI